MTVNKKDVNVIISLFNTLDVYKNPAILFTLIQLSIKQHDFNLTMFLYDIITKNINKNEASTKISITLPINPTADDETIIANLPTFFNAFYPPPLNEFNDNVVKMLVTAFSWKSKNIMPCLISLSKVQYK